jgi:hypothetical protein
VTARSIFSARAMISFPRDHVLFDHRSFGGSLQRDASRTVPCALAPVRLASAQPARCLMLRLCNFLEAIEFYFPVRKDDPLPKSIDVDYYPELQVHGIDVAGQVVMRRQLKRRYVLKFFENGANSEPSTHGPSLFCCDAQIAAFEMR